MYLFYLSLAQSQQFLLFIDSFFYISYTEFTKQTRKYDIAASLGFSDIIRD